MNKIYFVLISVGLFTGCDNKQNQQTTAENVITINDLELITSFKASDIFENITLIPLETTDVCLIGYISKIEITNDAIYALDIQSKSVFAFNKE
jgi:hypothetical protein